MKTFFLSLIPIFLFALGVFAMTRMVKFQPWTKPGQEDDYKAWRQIVLLPTVEANASKQPKIECAETEFDFGIMAPFEQGAHVFSIINSGDEQLVLKNGGKSCSCLDVDLSAVLLKPGEKKDIEVRWDTDKSGKLAQYVKILTNSAETPELQLWVTGMVATILDVSVTEFSFATMLSGEVRSREFFVFSELWEGVTIDRIETSSDDLTCDIIEKAHEVEVPARILSNPEKPVDFKSRIDFRMSIKAQSQGPERTEKIKIFVRPPQELASPAEAGAPSVEQASAHRALQPDGTFLIELPVSTKLVRRLTLYGPAIADGDKKLIDLGKLRTTSAARDWAIIAKIRGDQFPTDMKVSLTGIEGVSASIEKVESSVDQQSLSYRIKIHAQEKLKVGVYNHEDAGKLTIEAPGLPGEELHEFTVELDVLEEN